MKEEIKGINEIGDAMGLDEDRKADLQEIVMDRLFRGCSIKESLERSIKRKLYRKNDATN